MPLTLIKGTFSIKGAAPDGDSIRFIPDDPSLWQRLENRVRPNRSGGVQLRLDAIDALETHFQPRIGAFGTQRQPEQFGDKAAARLLDLVGFDSTTVERGRGEVIRAADPSTVKGYILTRFADTYGRAIAFAFGGESDESDGDSLFVTSDQLEQSANYQLVAEGLVYPTFYSKLYVDLRSALTAAAEAARSAESGLWAEDVTNKGFELERLQTITEEAVILPKLFRRLINYLAINDDSVDLSGFSDYLKGNDDRVLVLSEGRITGFDNLIEVNEQTLRLIHPPEDLVFIEK
jgi:endonuclease YncB( thermonuclease family)